MKLRTRFALLMVVCALVPLVGGGLLARSVLTRRYEQADTQRRTAAVARVERTLEARASAQQRTLARFCAHDYLIDRTLLQLETGQFSETSRAELGAVLPEVRQALGFDALSLVRGDGVVLASAHYPGQAGSRDAETFRLAARRREADRWVRPVRVRDRDGPRDRLVLESSCVRRRGTAAVAVSGGEAVDGRLLQDLAGDEGVTARIVLGGVSETGAPNGLRRVLPLRGPNGETVAAVVVESSDRELRELVAELDAIGGVAAVAAVLMAVLLAVVLASRLSRPIAEVADAADLIAKGDRSVQIKVKSGGEVGRLVAAFNHMTRELDGADARLRRAERMAAWRDIARQMAHEIKNPLTPIRMAVEMLRKARERNLPEFDELFDEESRIVLDEVERLRRLVENFSRFARAPRPKPEALALPDVVAHVVELHAGGAVPVSYAVEGGEEAFPTLRADRDQLTQVLVNLVANGCHAAEERATKDPSRGAGRVHVRVADARDGFARVVVEDNGGGIPPAVMDRLFEPYVTSKEGGTGLGLAVVFRIVTDHGGTITPETSGNGTRFTIRLPFAGPPPMTETLPEWPQAGR